MKTVRAIKWNVITLQVLHLSCGHKRRFQRFEASRQQAEIEEGYLIRCRACESNVQIARIVDVAEVELVTAWEVKDK